MCNNFKGKINFVKSSKYQKFLGKTLILFNFNFCVHPNVSLFFIFFSCKALN